MGPEYPSTAPSWRRAWQEIIPSFAVPPAVRKIIYTTNAIESLSRICRKNSALHRFLALLIPKNHQNMRQLSNPLSHMQAWCRAMDDAKLIDVIIAGILADQVKDRMLALDARRIELEAQLAHAPAPSSIRIHPKMAETYREKITTLIRQLQQPDGMPEAKEALRGLVDRITLKAPEPGAKLAIHLEGALAEVLMLNMETKRQTGQMPKAQGTEYIDELVPLAGARFRKYLPLYSQSRQINRNGYPNRSFCISTRINSERR